MTDNREWARRFHEPCPHGSYKEGTEFATKGDCEQCTEAILAAVSREAAANALAAAIEKIHREVAVKSDSEEGWRVLKACQSSIKSTSLPDGSQPLQAALIEVEIDLLGWALRQTKGPFNFEERFAELYERKTALEAQKAKARGEK